jgi:hypothetical protein
MPKYEITAPDGRKFEVTAPDGATQEQVLSYAQQQFSMQAKPERGFGERMNDAIADVPRQVGLTARYGLEGLGDVADFLSAPIRAGLNAAGADIKPGSGRYLADLAGLPEPQNATERVVGDASRLLAGSALPVGLAKNVAGATTGATQKVAQAMAANPAQQAVSAASAGGAGGYVRETGGNDAAQGIASFAAGIAAPYATNKAIQSGSSAQRFARSKVAQPINIDVRIDSALRDSGIRLSDLPDAVRNGIRNDVRAALKIDQSLDGNAIARLADYRLVGATPRVGNLTLDPVRLTLEKNLAKVGANSKDPAAQSLARAENDNNRVLIERLNEFGAGTADDAIAGGQKIIGALDARNQTAKSLIGQRYDAARASTGRRAALDPSAFTQRANALLDDALLGGKLPGDVRNLLNKTAQGEMPLTVDIAEQFKTRIGELQRSTTDMAERKALGMVRQALDDTPLLDGQGQQAIDAFNKARRLNRAWMGIVERTPALQAVRDGIEPDKFVQTFIVGNGSKAHLADLAALKRAVKGNPEAMNAVREQIAAHLKKSALNGAADEVGNFSQSGYNKALKQIGERKLSLFFSGDELAQMKAVGRVSSYEQVQPRGSAVNNSNTAPGIAGLLERIGDSPLMSNIPLGQFISGPAQNIAIGMNAKRAMDVPQGLLAPRLPMANQQPAGLLMSPALLMQPEDERKGLLRP